MFNLIPNITKQEKILRGLVGALLLISVLTGLSNVFAFIIGLLFIASAALSYCGVYDLLKRYKIVEGSETATATKQETTTIITEDKKDNNTSDNK